MPSLTVTRIDNAQYSPRSRPVVVVFGSTSGIGEGIVRAFARNTDGNVHIIILGRSRPSADAIIASLPKHENGLYEFVAVDAVLMRNVAAACTELKTNANGQLQAPLLKINYLVLSQGAVLFGAPDTEDGHNPMTALALYGRIRAILELVSLLEMASELGEDGRVMSIGAAGIGGPVDLSDVGMKKTSYLKLRGALVSTVDISILELASRHPTVSFTHVHPGFVATNFKSNLSWPIRIILGAVQMFFARSCEDCGEWMMHALVDSTTKTGAHFTNPDAKPIKASPYAVDTIARGVVWDHLVAASSPKI